MCPTDYAHCNEFYKQCTERCMTWLNSLPKPANRPEELYHFTDGAGLAAILASRTLRVSLATSLNDCSEIQYGVNLAEEILRARVEHGSDDLAKEALFCLRDPEWTKGRLELAPFVVSFCGRVDKSALWLHYGKAGRGVAIGFDFDWLATKRNLETGFTQVEYEPAKQKALVDGLWDQLEDVPMPDAESDEERRLLRIIAGHAFTMCLPALCTKLKLGHFQEEEEWRLFAWEGLRKSQFVMSAGKTRYRVVDDRIVPYQEIKLDPDAIRSVVLGYSSPMDENDLGLRMLAHAANPKITISRSTVPIR